MVDLDVVDICTGAYYGSDDAAATAPNPHLRQQRFTHDVDAWANEMHQQLLERAKLVEAPTP